MGFSNELPISEDDLACRVDHSWRVAELSPIPGGPKHFYAPRPGNLKPYEPRIGGVHSNREMGEILASTIADWISGRG